MLEFDYEWATHYCDEYALSLQLVVVTTSIISGSIFFFIAAEVFVKTSTQYVFYYLIWNKGVFTNDDWWWTTDYHGWFGQWYTIHQLTLSFGSLTLMFVLYAFYKHYFVNIVA